MLLDNFKLKASHQYKAREDNDKVAAPAKTAMTFIKRARAGEETVAKRILCPKKVTV